jgi:hypothetical protein
VFELKRLTSAGVPAALEKAEQYRLLNQPWSAESICWDIAAVDPANQAALRTRLLAQTDQFGHDMGAVRRAREALAMLTDDYERAYYTGLICERLAKAQLDHHSPGSRFHAYDELRDAMEWYEKAEAMRPTGDDDAILRWNTCARLLNQSPHIVPRSEEMREPEIGE